MPQFDARYVVKLREAVTSFLADTSAYLRVQGWNPAAGSQASTERQTYVNPGSIVNAWCLAQQLIELGADHLSALSKLLADPVETNAVWTCVRSMLESCGLATWLLDPEIGGKDRAARTFALRFEGMQQQLKYGKATNTPEIALELIEKQITKMENDAIYQGFARLQKKGKRTAVAMPMPAATHTIKATLDEEATFRLLSAVAHGHAWAMLGLGYKPVTGVADDDSQDVVTMPFEKTVNFQAAAVFGMTAMKALARPLWNQCLYFGGDAHALTQIFEKAADSIEMSDPPRFWKRTTTSS